MTVETNARFISDLNEAYPTQRDLINEGDDHLRLLKSVLKSTFPGMDQSVTMTSEKINQLDSSFTYGGEDTITVSSSLTLAEGLNVDAGGATISNIGDPKKGTDAVNLQSLQGSMMWPVGSVFMTISAGSPETILGFGKWKRFAEGRVIIGSGSNSDINNVSKTFVNESTGGEYEHKLTPDEIAPHKHGLSNVTISEGGAHTHPVEQNKKNVTGFTPNGGHGGTSGGGRNDGDGTIYTVSAGEHTHKLEGEVESSGGDKPHNNIQPYIACNIWVRLPDEVEP